MLLWASNRACHSSSSQQGRQSESGSRLFPVLRKRNREPGGLEIIRPDLLDVSLKPSDLLVDDEVAKI